MRRMVAGRMRAWAQGARRISIAGRLALAFGLVLALFAGTTGFALWQMRAMQRDMEQAFQAGIDIAGRAGQMRRSIDRIFMNALMLSVATDKTEIGYLKQEFDQARVAYARAKQELGGLTHDGANLPALVPVFAKLTDAEAVNLNLDDAVDRRVATAAATADDGELDVDQTMVSYLAGNVKNRFEFWVRTVDGVIEVTATVTAERRARATATAALAGVVQSTAAALALLFGALAAWWIARGVARPLRGAVQVAESVARGELDTAIPPGGGDETGALLAALARMQSSLNALVREVRDSAHSIETVSAEVSAGNGALSCRTDVVAGRLRRTADSVRDLTQAVDRSATSAKTADSLARGAAGAAARGGEVVLQVVQAMEAIAAQSSKIAEIVGTIDGIAFQTNILALNAAVEAAGAGAHGRGFAVVAAEVRSLAQRAATAAGDIKAQIDASVQAVRAGSRLAQDAGGTMRDIVASVQQVTQAMDEIAKSAAAQSTGLGEIAQSMDDIDHLTHENVQLVERGAATAGSLEAQAQRLSTLMGAFRLDSGPGA